MNSINLHLIISRIRMYYDKEKQILLRRLQLINYVF